MKHFLVLLLLFIGIGSVTAQNARITGTVKDNTGEAVIGANIKVKEHADEISTVNFEVTTQDEYATKMTAAMTAGELPDIFYVGPEAVRSYVDNGYVQPLDDLVDATAVDNLWPAIKSAYMYMRIHQQIWKGYMILHIRMLMRMDMLHILM